MALREVTILLPAYNEEKAIGKVIDDIRISPLKCDILVGDNISSDRTYDIVKGTGITPIRVYRRGKGNVIRTLLKQVDTPYVIMLNADYTYPATYIPTIYNLLSVSGADVVLGCRYIKEKDSMTLMNSLGNWGLSLLASILYGKRVYDICTGMWGFRTNILKGFNLTSKGFTLEADLFVNAVRNGNRIEQVPIAYRKRLDGSKAKLKVRDGLKIALFLIKRRVRW